MENLKNFGKFEKNLENLKNFGKFEKFWSLKFFNIFEIFKNILEVSKFSKFFKILENFPEFFKFSKIFQEGGIFFFLGHLGLFQFWKPVTSKTSAFKHQKFSNFTTFKIFFSKNFNFQTFSHLESFTFSIIIKNNYFLFYWIFLFLFLFLKVYFRPRNYLAAAGSL